MIKISCLNKGIIANITLKKFDILWWLIRPLNIYISFNNCFIRYSFILISFLNVKYSRYTKNVTIFLE